MSSINLLPKDFGFKKDPKRQKKIVAACSIFLMVVSIISFIAVHVDKTVASKRSDFLDSKMEEINSDIEEEINSNELFLITNKVESIRELLDNHSYFSKVFNVVQNVISENVYLTESELTFSKEGNLILEISGVANNYSAAVNQIATFKNSYWIEEAEINSITSDDSKAGDSGEISFSGNLKFKEDLISFREYYWDFGLALLSSKVDRYIKIDKYSASLTDEESNGKNSIKVKFSGIAYDEERLILFKSNLEMAKIFVENVSISYDLNRRDDNKIIKFEGEMDLELF
jgi:PKD repeat protein